MTLFTERDSRLILSIPLSLHDCDDVWMWSEGQKGVYTGKSGYIFLMHDRHSPSAEALDWNLLWELKVAAKVRNFYGELFRLVCPH